MTIILNRSDRAINVVGLSFFGDGDWVERVAVAGDAITVLVVNKPIEAVWLFDGKE